MKKLVYLLTAVALLWGCEKEQNEILPGGNEEENVVTEIIELPEVLHVSMAAEEESSETRTYIENQKIYWQNGDAISFFAGNTHNAKYSYNGEDGETTVELTKDAEIVGTTGQVLLKSQAVYPYNKDVTVVYDEKVGVDKINLTYPTSMKYGDKSFGKEANIMVAAGENNSDDDLFFHNACGYLVIKLYGVASNDQPTSIKKITLSSVSGIDKIAGKAVIVANAEAAPVITMADDASSSVTLDCANGGSGVALGTDAEHATEFWFCLPPVTFTDGIKITVDDVYGNSYTKQTSKTVNIERNMIQPMAALEFKSNAPTATKLWYTRSDDSTEPLKFYVDNEDAFNAPITKHAWDPTLKQIVIEFGAPLTTIQTEAFRDTKIATITLPEGVTTIEEGAFESSTLREITFPGSMLNIGVNAFWECTELESLTFLPNVTNTPLNICNMENWGGTDWGTFCDSKLTYINLNRELNYVDEDGDKFTPDSDDDGLFYHENYDSVEKTTVIIGPQVKTLSYKMFQHLPIEEISIPGTVTTIENNVFEGCSKLKRLTFEPSVDDTPLTMGYDDAGDDDGPFIDSPLETVELNRDIHYTFGGWTIDTDTEGLFGSKPTLVSVTLGEQVKTLSNNMFADAAITEIVIPGSVNTIGNDVFHQCTSLAKVTFEPSATATPLTMGYDTDGEDENLFQDNNALTTLVLDREIIQTQTGVDTNSEGLFGGMPTLASITLGQQVKTLSDFMFAGSSIEELVIPGTVTTIANYVFDDCENLKKITFESGSAVLNVGYSGGATLFVDTPLETVELDREVDYLFPSSDLDDATEGLFGAKKELTKVTLGDNVKTLSPYMFAGSGLTAINLNKVETIENNALEGLALTSLTIPGGVNTIGDSVFADCNKLVTITFEPSIDGKALAISSCGGYSPFFDSPLTTLDLNRELKYSIPGQPASGLFGAKEDLTKVTLGDQVKTLSPFMFANSGLTSLDLNKVETIQTRALLGLALTSLTIPGFVKSIDNSVFVNCTELKELTFNPNDEDEALKIGFYDGVTDDEGPFYDCPLTTINLNRELDYDFDGTTPDDATEGVFGGKNTLTSVTLGSKVRSLSNFMFAEAGITTITIPGTLTNVSNDAFADCSTLTSLVFEQGVQPLTMGYNTVGDDDGPFVDSPLKSIVLNRVIDYTFPGPDTANEGLFGGKSALTSVNLGDDVKTLLPYMFANAGFATLNLNKVETISSYALTNSAITNITFPATLTEICNHAFNGCSSLSSLVFESGATPLTMGFQLGGAADHGPFFQSPLSYIKLDREIELNDSYKQYGDESDEGIFSNDHYSNDELGVTKVVLGSNVKTIHPYMFAKTRVQQLHLPETIETIGKNVIEDNTVINAIVFYDEKERPDVADDAFGADSNGLLAGLIPGDYQYYIFVPRYRGRLSSPENELYFTTDDLVNNTYWDALHPIVVDDQPTQSYPQARAHESRYLDVAGYEWYRERYYNGVTITPPMDPAE